MKRLKMLSATLLGCVFIGSVGALAGCGEGEPKPTENDDPVLNFVSVYGTNWDADVTIDQKVFKLSLDLNADNTLTLAGTCTGKSEQGGGGFPGGGFPGGGFPDGGFPGSEDTGGDNNEDTEEEPEITDYTIYNFEIDGTLSLNCKQENLITDSEICML